MDYKSKIILIAGPTASGKSKIAINLAKKINGEIFNVGFENVSVDNLANTVKEVLGGNILIKKTSTYE